MGEREELAAIIDLLRGEANILLDDGQSGYFLPAAAAARLVELFDGGSDGDETGRGGENEGDADFGDDDSGDDVKSYGAPWEGPSDADAAGMGVESFSAALGNGHVRYAVTVRSIAGIVHVVTSWYEGGDLVHNEVHVLPAYPPAQQG